MTSPASKDISLKDIADRANLSKLGSGSFRFNESELERLAVGPHIIHPYISFIHPSFFLK